MKTKAPDVELTRASDNVFSDLGFSPAESKKLAIKAALMAEIRRYITEHSLTQAKAAAQMHVTRPRISDVQRGMIDKFTIDALVDMLARVGINVELKVTSRAA